MFSIARIRPQFAALPLLVRIGLAVMVFAGLGDMVVHLEATDHVGHLHEHTSAELQAHLTGFVGMVLVFVGVVADGVRQQRLRKLAEANSKGVA
jgi:hypothetical protein